MPNPCDGEAKITSPEIIDEIEVRNMPEQLIYKAKPGKKTVSVKMDAAGLYFISVTSGTRTVTRKLAVCR